MLISYKYEMQVWDILTADIATGTADKILRWGLSAIVGWLIWSSSLGQ